MTTATDYKCGECDGLLIDNPDLSDDYPLYCEHCDITYDWEHWDGKAERNG